MRISLRPALILLAVVVLNLGVRGSFGFYAPEAFAATVAALALGFAACVVGDRRIRIARSGPRNATALLLVIAALTLGVIAVGSTQLFYVDNRAAEQKVFVWAWLMLVLTAIIGIVVVLVDVAGWRSGSPPPYPPRLGGSRGGVSRFANTFTVLAITLLVAAILGAIALRAKVIAASPEPVIDVFNLLRDDADYIIAGVNPYQSDIISPYGTARAIEYGVVDPPDPRPAGYPPLPYLLCVPSRLLGGDPRWSNVAGDCLAALALAWLGFCRGRPLIAVLVAAMYLNLPRAPFLIEQAWYEPMIAALFGLGFVLAEFNRWPKWLGYAFLGLALTAKQFGLPLLFPLAWGHRKNWRLILFGLLVGALVILPWFIWSPSAFLDVVLFKHLQRPPQFASITIGSFFVNEFGIELPRIVGWLFATIAIIAIARFTPKGPAAALGLGSALLAFCFCHTQGYINYFFLVQYLWLFGFLASLPAPEASSQSD